MATHLPKCANCGEPEWHYVMPCGASPGYYTCGLRPMTGRVQVTTAFPNEGVDDERRFLIFANLMELF